MAIAGQTPVTVVAFTPGDMQHHCISTSVKHGRLHNLQL